MILLFLYTICWDMNNCHLSFYIYSISYIKTCGKHSFQLLLYIYLLLLYVFMILYMNSRPTMNLKNTIEDILLKISSLEVTSIQALFSLVGSPEAEPFLHGISESSGNIETLEQVRNCYYNCH